MNFLITVGEFDTYFLCHLSYCSCSLFGHPRSKEAAAHGDLIDSTENTEAHQLTEAALKLKALEMKKKNIKAQLATKKRALDQANKLAEAKRRLAEMEAELESFAEGIPRNARRLLPARRPCHPLDSLRSQ